jgi:cbb3-type cytochrome oxidase subunit 3
MLISVMTATGLGYSGVFAVAFGLYLLRLRYSLGCVGQVGAVGLMVLTLVAVPIGISACRWNARSILLLGAVMGIANALNVPAGQMLLGVTFIGAFILTVYGLELVDAKWRPAMTGATRMAMEIRVTAAGFLGGPLIGVWGYGALFGVAAMLTLAVGPLVWAYNRARRQAARPEAGGAVPALRR